MLPLRDATAPRRTPVVTLALLAACTLVFAYELFLEVQGTGALDRFVVRRGLVPAELVGAIESGDVLSGPALDLVTHMFLHGGWLHLMGNALFLWIFGPRLEDRLGRILFLAVYLAGGLAAAAGHVLSDPASDIPMIGASGAISAVLGAYLVLFPRARIQSLVFLVFFYELISVPAVVVLGFWFVLQLVDGFASLGLTAEGAGGVAFWAHIGGFVAGALLALPLRLLHRAKGSGEAAGVPRDAVAVAGGATEPGPVPAPEPSVPDPRAPPGPPPAPVPQPPPPPPRG